jgi:hypothetical protein
MTHHASVQDNPAAHVCVDPRIELMGAVQLLAGYFLVSPYASAYRDAVQRHVGHLADHPAVVGFAKLAAADFCFDAVPHAMLCLSDPPALRPRVPFPDDVIARAGGKVALDAWLDDLRAFAGASDFAAFVAAQQPIYVQLVALTQPGATAALDALRDYLGHPLPHCTLILGLLLHHGGFASLLEPPTAPPHAYALLGPTGVVDDVPIFGTTDEIAGIAWHEWSHTVINPLADAHADAIAQLADRFSPIADVMAAQAYPTWQITVVEHLVRAVTVRLIARTLGAAAGAAALADEQRRGFRFITPLVERLAAYEAARDRYPTIDQFVPVLLAALRES